MHGMPLILILTRRVCLPCSYVCTSGTEAYDCDSKIKMTLYEASTMNLQLKNRVVQLSEQLEALQDVVAKKLPASAPAGVDSGQLRCCPAVVLFQDRV